METRNDLELFFFKNFEIAANGLSQELSNHLRGANLFITGGTGFFGSWILWLLHWLNQEHQISFKATVLSRAPALFIQTHPEFEKLKFLDYLTGDVRNFTYPEKHFTHILHGATTASARLNQDNPLLMLNTIVEGTAHVLNFAKHCGAGRLLLTSSGAVYGKQPPHLTHIPEDYLGAPDLLSPASAYGEGKRLAEHLCALHLKQNGIQSIVARCFAFVGPYLPLDTHFAIGNFLKDGISKQSISVHGDGTPLRSYLYGADLAVWLLTLLTRGTPGSAYNVGSEESLSIHETAKTVSETLNHLGKGSIPVNVALNSTNQLSKPEQYIPLTNKARNELGLRQNFSLVQAIQETILWYDLTHSDG